MLWLAGKMAREAWRSAGQSPHIAGVRPHSQQLFKRGLLLALASPSILWLAAVGGALIANATDGSVGSAMRFLGGFFAGGLAWSSFIVAPAHHGGRTLGPRFIQGCHLVSAALYLYFALLVLDNGARNLL